MSNRMWSRSEIRKKRAQAISNLVASVIVMLLVALIWLNVVLTYPWNFIVLGCFGYGMLRFVLNANDLLIRIPTQESRRKKALKGLQQ